MTNQPRFAENAIRSLLVCQDGVRRIRICALFRRMGYTYTREEIDAALVYLLARGEITCERGKYHLERRETAVHPVFAGVLAGFRAGAR